MGKNNYEIKEYFLNSIPFNLLVLKIPEEELNDKLTYFTDKKGLIPVSLFVDFLIINCVANVNQFLQFLSDMGVDVDLLNKARKEASDLILSVNDSLRPDNLVLSKNNVVKLYTCDNDSDRKLVDNDWWKLDIYKSKNVAPDEGAQTCNEGTEAIKYELTEMFWTRLNKYIKIKKFTLEDGEELIRNKPFKNKTDYEKYVVTVFIEDVESLFIHLDELGLPSRVSSYILVHELFQLCKSVNSFLPAIQQKDSCRECDDPFGNIVNEEVPNPFKELSKYKNKLRLFKHVEEELLLNIEKEITSKIIGQDKAVEQLVNAIQRSSVGLKDPTQPIGSFMFAGSTGIGKTELSKVLADELIGDRKGLVTIDCSEYSADHEYSKLIGCFVPGTPLLIESGALNVIEHVKKGNKVISHKGKTRNVEKVFEFDYDGPMVKMRIANSNDPIITTPWHEVLAIKHKRCDKGLSNNYRVCKPTCRQLRCSTKLYEDYKLDWYPASQLEKNDIVVYPRYKSTFVFPEKLDLVNYLEGTCRYKYDDKYVWAQAHVKVPRYIEVNNDLMRLAGYYVSEGGSISTKKGVCFTFNNKETTYIVETVRLLRKIFGKDVRISVNVKAKKHSCSVYIFSKVVCRFMSDLFGSNVYVKQVPSWFKDLPDDNVKNFLETAVFGDGCTVIPRRMDYSTVSPALFSQMQLLFRRLGYITSVSVESPENKAWKDRYRILIGGNQIVRLSNEFEKMNINLKGLGETNIQRKSYIDEDYVYYQVNKIENITYKGKLHDISVEEDVSYVVGVGGMAVHNSAPGYIGHNHGGRLTNAVKKQPFSVVLFDEIEKASDKVYQLLLQIMDEGRLTDGKGNTVSFKDTVVIMTSNIGVDEVKNIEKTIGFGEVSKVTQVKKDTAINKAIKDKFRPEFLNRVTSIINFKDLSRKEYLQIIKLELERLMVNLKINRTKYSGITLGFDKSIYNFIYRKGIDVEYGARYLKRTIDKEISTPLAAFLLNNTITDDSIIDIRVKKSKLRIDLVESKNEDIDIVDNLTHEMSDDA